jgi:hypothetical protein
VAQYEGDAASRLGGAAKKFGEGHVVRSGASRASDCDREVATDYSAHCASLRCAVRAARKPSVAILGHPRDACVAPLRGRPKGRSASSHAAVEGALD